MNRPTRVFIQLARNQDAAKWRERYLRGEVPDAVPYGYHHAERTGLSLAYSVDSPRVRGDTPYRDVSHTAFLEMKYWKDSSIDVFKAYCLPNN